MSASRNRVSAETPTGSPARAPRASAPSPDRGVLLGDGLFETIRVYEDRPFRLEAHLSRLRAGALRVGIPVPERLEEEVEAALAAWRKRGRTENRPEGSDRGTGVGALRVTLTRGGGAGLLPAREGSPGLITFVSPYAPDPEVQRRGLSAYLRGRVDENALTAGLKTIGYLERIVALREARASGGEEALLLNSRGDVVEGSASNLFAVTRGATGRVLCTPSTAEGALPGITRGIVLSLASSLGLDIEERAPRPEELARSEEVFLTSSLRELAPVVTIEGRPIGSGAPGDVFRSLRAGFREIVRREVGA